MSGSGNTRARGLPLMTAIAGALALVAAAGIAVFEVATVPPKTAKARTLSGFGGPFRLTDQNGRIVTDADFHGKWMLLYFGYTHCPDACPTALNSIAEALDRLGPKRGKIQPVFVSLDPQRDTPSVLKDYTRAFQAGILGLTGTPDQVDKVAREYRIAYEKRPTEGGSDYSIDHTAVIFLVDPQGAPVTFFSQEIPSERIAQTIDEEMR